METTAVCSICLDDNADVELPCHHLYHFECIKEWFAQGRSQKTCPYCRYNLYSNGKPVVLIHIPDSQLMNIHINRSGFVRSNVLKYNRTMLFQINN